MTEAIWKELGLENFLMISNWPDVKNYPKDYHGYSYYSFHLARSIIKAIRDARAKNKIEPSKKVKAVICVGYSKDSERARKFVELEEELIKNLKTGISELEILDKKPKIDKAIHVSVADIEIYLLVAIDKKKEKARIQKEIKNLENMIKNTEVKLSNKEFMKKAPKKVVKKEKENLKIRKNEMGEYKKRLKELK